MKWNDFKALNLQEAGLKEGEFRQELLNLRIRQVAGQLEKSSRVRDLRRAIARLETLKTQIRTKSKTK